MARDLGQDVERALGEVARLQDAARLSEAQALLQHLLQRYPQDLRIQFFYGVQLRQQQNIPLALQTLVQVAAGLSSFPEVHAQLGELYLEVGQHRQARDAWQRFVTLQPDHPRGLYGLGLSELGAGQRAQAQDVLDRLLPHAEVSSDMLCTVAQACGAHGEPAMAERYFRRVLAREPRLEAAIEGLATALAKQAQWAEAAALLRQLAALRPADSAVWRDLGTALLGDGQLLQALQAYRQGAALRGDPDEALARESSLHSLKLLQEQLGHLRGLELLPPQWAGAPAQVGEVVAQVRTAGGGPGRVQLSARQMDAIGHLTHRLLYLDAGEAPASGMLNRHLDGARITAQYMARTPGIVVIDDFLSPDGLRALQRYLRRSTFWFDYAKAGGYSGAYMQDGFAGPLLGALVQELTAALPDLLGAHPLRQMWGYIYDCEREGITLHADSAAMNLNFWLTPDSANIDSSSGGLIIYTREAPLEWDFERYNNHPAQMRQYVEGSEKVVVPYRCNRLVLFRSNLIHETDQFSFREGLLNRRLNVTMLFGERGA